MKPRKTVVTGATGFLGRRVCAKLVEQGEPVVALGRRFEGFPSFDAALCTRRQVPLEDADALTAAFHGADVVIHSAALCTVWGARRDFLRVNVEGTQRVIDAARAAGVRRLVHVSSSSVAFDNQDRRDLNEAAPRPAKFLATYCETKALAEDVVSAAQGVEWVIVRPRGIFGPGDTTILPRLVARARQGRLRILGQGRNIQDLTYVDNVADALLLARDAPFAAGHTYFLSNGEPVVLWDFIGACLRGIGLNPPTRHVSLSVAFALAGAMEAIHSAIPALGEPALTRYTVSLLARDQTLDITAARRDLGYAPKVTMSDALARTIEDFRHAAQGGMER